MCVCVCMYVYGIYLCVIDRGEKGFGGGVEKNQIRRTRR